MRSETGQSAQSSTGSPRGPSLPPPRYVDKLAERLGSGSLSGLVGKLLFLGVVNAGWLYAVLTLFPLRAWTPLIVITLATAALDYVYLSRNRLPAKFLLPGTLVLLVFQVYPVLYTGYIGFTNYGQGTNLTPQQAINRNLADSVFVPEDATRYDMVPLVELGNPETGELALLLTDPEGNQFLGTADGLQELDEGAIEGEGLDRVVDGRFQQLPLNVASARQTEIGDFEVPVDPGDLATEAEADAIRVRTLSTAVVAIQRLEYDEATGNIVDTVDGTVFTPIDGRFTAEDGRTLNNGFRVTVGFSNYQRVLTSPELRGPFLRVFVWTFVFATLSVVFSFVVGLGLALTLDDPRLKLRRTSRSLLLIPYALPSFMTALIWQGLLNGSFGQINRVLSIIFNTDVTIPWITSQAYAGALPKFSVLLVNTWLGFGYMFLITTGALQAIPSEVKEAASVDGATGWQTFRRIILPLLLVAVGPLLIASFAFNFNNFNTVFLLTGGGPPIRGTAIPVGHTDILISFSYRLAFDTGRPDYGLAAAVSTLIFFLVAIFSFWGFKRTAVLEEIN
jgi:arabinogalactan oligomer / maltooligosaccharide transport system permease protein